jgi:hypothetical protein
LSILSKKRRRIGECRYAPKVLFVDSHPLLEKEGPDAAWRVIVIPVLQIGRGGSELVVCCFELAEGRSQVRGKGARPRARIVLAPNVNGRRVVRARPGKEGVCLMLSPGGVAHEHGVFRTVDHGRIPEHAPRSLGCHPETVCLEERNVK